MHKRKHWQGEARQEALAQLASPHLAFPRAAGLFQEFRLDEPWDSPHNRTLIEKMPSVFRLTRSKTEQGWTNYVVFVGSGAGFAVNRPTAFSEIRDGMSNTVMIAESDDEHAVIWTKPEDRPFDPDDPSKGLGQFFDHGFNTAYFDGSVRFIPPSIPPEMLRALITRSGREVVTGF